MKCKACKYEILDSDEYIQMALVPAECEEGYRKFGMAPTMQYCSDCSNDMRRYIFEKHNQPERSKREDLIEMMVPPEPETLTKMRLDQDVEFVKNCAGVNPDLLGCGALNSMET
jgi:hypothetical protein